MPPPNKDEQSPYYASKETPGSEPKESGMPPPNKDEQSPLLNHDLNSKNSKAKNPPLSHLFEEPTADELSSSYRVPLKDLESKDDAALMYEDYQQQEDEGSTFCCSTTPTLNDITVTATGSLVFAIYHTVFCLAMSSSILRPHASEGHSSTGSLAKLAALGVLFSGPTFIYQLGSEVPAIYPAADLFLAPFLAQIAVDIDRVLAEQGLENEDALFLSTFVAVTACFGLVLSGLLCIVASRFKLANLGLFLPYSVLCGFFSTVGILMWTLGFAVDTGSSVASVLQQVSFRGGGDFHVVSTALMHHLPSVAIGITMHLMGRQHPFWVIAIMLLTVLGSYGVLWVTGVSLQEATDAKWFFSIDDLVSPQDNNETRVYWKDFGPPLPFGGWVALFRGDVVWDAAAASLPPVLSLAFLYLIRCSVQAAALKKNIRNVTREPPALDESSNRTQQRQVFSQRSEKKKPLTLNYMLEHGYGYSQLASALVGGITVAPAVAASLTMFRLKAEKPPPQYGSCILMLIMYMTDFRLVQYIPKPSFACLMILASIDMCRTWMVGSYFKTKAKLEWMVAPILVVAAFAVGMLKAIFLGIAVSTFIFASNVYRSGSVKFVGTGRSLRSTVERGVRETEFLECNADLIQILVLQNYLFFGNVQSVFTYVSTMFEDLDEVPRGQAASLEQSCHLLLPKPSVVVMDFALVSGFDTSAIDQLREMVELCRENKCKLMLAGLTPSFKSALVYAGLKPEGGIRSRFAYMTDLESALAKAEDILLSDVFHLKEMDEKETQIRQSHRTVSNADDGFAYALLKIDEQHGLDVAHELRDLAPYTTLVEVKAGEALVRQGSEIGLYFVETGLMQISTLSPTQSALNTASVSTLPNNVSTALMNRSSTESIGHLNAREGELDPQASSGAARQRLRATMEHSSRLAKIGQGWIIGCVETAERVRMAGIHVAISDCRLHHVSHSSILEIESTNPALAMNLYKLLSLLATKRQESTIYQLEQFMKVMKNPVPRLRGGRRELSQLSIH